MEASLARPLRRTTTLQVFGSVVGDRGVGRWRAGNNQGRGRAIGHDSRTHSRTRGASGTKRSWPPVPFATRTRRRAGSRSEPCRRGPSVKRQPPA